MSRSGDAVPRQRAVNSTSHSRKADGASVNVSNTPHETVKHCHGEELENIGRKILTSMISKHGLKNWQTVAHAIPGRSAPQCRQSGDTK
ncbi:hypothetical protein ACQ4PT_012757 [Festuca glaucescens]